MLNTEICRSVNLGGFTLANITKRGNTFRIRVFVGCDMNGKQLVKSTTYTPPDGVTPKKAEKLAQEYAFEFERHCKGYSQLNENMRFSELADWYFTNYAPQELKESTIYTYKGQYKNHIEPVLGNVKVKDINAPRLTQIMQSYNLNPATVKKLYVIVQSIFRRGAEQGFIRDTPCRNVILPKRKKSRKNKALEEDKLKRFMEYLESKPWDEDFKRIIKVLLYTGMRSGECLGLAWEDIDFENNTISINHTLTDIGGKHELTDPKTESSIRVVPIHDRTYPFFKKWYEDDNEYLLHTPDGKQFIYRNYYDSYWTPVIELIGCSHKPHDTRHTCISMMTEKEVSPTLIKKIVGHSGAMSLTEKVYTHVNVQELLEAINKI